MKAIIIGPAYPFRGGIADTNQALCASMMKNGHDCSIITFTVQYPSFLFPGKTQYTADDAPKNISIRRLIHTFNPISWMRTVRTINKLCPDIIIVRYWLPLLAPCLGTIVRWLKKDILCVAMCDNIIPHEKRMGDKWLTQYFIRGFKGFITLSQTTYKELDAFTEKPKVYFPHPVNDHLGEKIDQIQAKKHLKLNVDKKYLLFFGLIRDYKGLDLTLQALAHPILEKWDLQLLIVGEFYEPKERYMKIIKTLKLDAHVHIIDQFVPSDDIKYYFSAVDLVIQTYKTASQSGVSQIAFHFECPILVTDVGGLSETITHQKVGYVAPKKTAIIAQYILDYFDNNRKDTFAQQMKIEKHKYSWKNFVKTIEKLYKEIVH